MEENSGQEAAEGDHEASNSMGRVDPGHLHYPLFFLAKGLDGPS